MKRFYILLLAFWFFSSLETSASHIAGGEIYYRYVGDSTGIAYQYKIELRLYRDVTGQSMPSTADVVVCPSCAPSFNVSLALVAGGPGYIYPTLFDCVSYGSLGTVSLEFYHYQGYCVIPDSCSSTSFSYSSCCRGGNVDNLLNPMSQAISISAMLTNTQTANTSAKFSSRIVRTLCVNKWVKLNFGATDEDQDSLYYELVNPRSNVSSCTFSNIPLAIGFSPIQPITTSPANPGIFNSNTGLFDVKPSAIGIYQIAVNIKEYRYNPLFMAFELVGISYCDIPIIVSPSCDAQAQQGTRLDHTKPGISWNPNNGQQIVEANCQDTVLTLNYYNQIDCLTLAADGSDYRMTTPLGAPFPITKSKATCDNGVSKVVKLVFASALNSNGNYKLYYKKGNDGSTLGTYCGFYAQEFDSISIHVTGCTGIGLDEEIETSSVFLSPNPTVDYAWFSTSRDVAMPFVVYDLQGKTLYVGFASHVDLSLLPKGVYIIKITQGKKNSYHKVLKA